MPGVLAVRPPLPGLDHPDIHVLRNIEDMDDIKAKVDAIAADPRAQAAVVIGAGYIGVEMAENLHQRGLAVEIVEMADQIMPPLDKELATPWRTTCARTGSPAPGHRGRGLRDRRPGAHRGADQRPVPEDDLVILSAGVRPNTQLAAEAGIELGPRGGIKVDRHMRTSDPDI